MGGGAEEQAKLSAALLNNVAVAAVSLGVLTPLVAYFYGIAPISEAVGPCTLVSGVVVWTTVAFMLHLMARSVLRILD